MLSFRRLALVAGLLVAGSVAVADAADPSSGKVDNTNRTVSWTGTLASSGITYNAWSEDDTFECHPPACDRFTLEVGDGPQDLLLKWRVLSENADGSVPGCKMRVVKPDNSVQLVEGECGTETDLKATLKAAVNGTYQIDVASSHVCCGAEDYEANATLGTGAVPVTPPTTTPPTTPPPSTTPAPKLSVQVGAQSARKLAKSRKFTATVTSNAKLTNVNALFTDRSKKLGSGRLATLEGSKKITIKISRKAKLKPGKTYQVAVGGTDAQGRTVRGTAKVKIKR